MDELLTFLLRWLNSEIALALVLAALFLLRPLRVRLFSHQQRAVLWTGVLLSGMICFGRRRAVYPVTFLDLVTPRVSMISGVEYLPGEYRGEGLYHLALPGGTLVPFSLSAWVLWLVLALWLAGMGVMVALCVRQSRALSRAAPGGSGWSGETPGWPCWAARRSIPRWCCAPACPPALCAGSSWSYSATRSCSSRS